MFGFIVQVLLLAVTIAFLGAWGIVKQQRKTEELLNKIRSNSESKILKELQKNNKITLREIESLIKVVKSSLFWSKSKLKVNDPSLLARELIKCMIENDKIQVEFINEKKFYVLK